MERDDGPGVRRVLYAIALLALIFLASLLGIQPPRALPADTSPAEFSASRAVNLLYNLMGSETPHPTGSDTNAAVRNRILEEFTKSGYSPQTQSVFDCDEYGVCATVQNVLARLDGTSPGPAVLLAAHYDSVAAGPGVSDDGIGAAAVLEAARALKSLPAPLHPIIFLLDDGEESGLLGAQAFVDFHPWASDVKAAVNIDARGTSGPSIMFETGTANDWAVRLYARGVSRPATSSIAYTAYKLLPNDTDFSVFKAAGYQGLNFALIGNAAAYHTPLDNVQNVDPASLQHQGNNALEAIRALANSDFSIPPPSDAVFFDVLGRWTIHWPAHLALLFAALASVLLAVQIAFLFWSGRLLKGEFFWGLAAWFMLIISLTIFGFLLQRLLLLMGGIQATWVAHPIPLQLTFWMLAAVAVMIHGMVFARRTGFWGLWTGIWAGWAVLALASAWIAPGVSYLPLVPLSLAALAGSPFALIKTSHGSAALQNASDRAKLDAPSGKFSLLLLLPLAASAVIGFAPAFLLYDGLGGQAIFGIAVLIGLILTPLIPFCVDFQNVRGLLPIALPGALIAILGLAAFGAVVSPAFSDNSPEHINLEYWQDSDAGSAQWLVEPDSGRLPDSIRASASFSFSTDGPFTWSPRPGYLAAAPNLNLAPPTFTILGNARMDSTQSYRTLLRSERAAPVAMLLFPPGSQVSGIRVGGISVTPQNARTFSAAGGWTRYVCSAMPEQGVEISFSLPVDKPVDILAIDQTYGLPLAGAFLLKARPETASPANAGDVTSVGRRVRIFP